MIAIKHWTWFFFNADEQLKQNTWDEMTNFRILYKNYVMKEIRRLLFLKIEEHKQGRPTD